MTAVVVAGRMEPGAHVLGACYHRGGRGPHQGPQHGIVLPEPRSDRVHRAALGHSRHATCHEYPDWRSRMQPSLHGPHSDFVWAWRDLPVTCFRHRTSSASSACWMVVLGWHTLAAAKCHVAWRGMAGRGGAWRGEARRGGAGQGEAGRGVAWRGVMSCGGAGRSMAGWGGAWRGGAGRGCGGAGRGVVSCGGAGQVRAGRGVVWHGPVAAPNSTTGAASGRGMGITGGSPGQPTMSAPFVSILYLKSIPPKSIRGETGNIFAQRDAMRARVAQTRLGQPRAVLAPLGGHCSWSLRTRTGIASQCGGLPPQSPPPPSSCVQAREAKLKEELEGRAPVTPQSTDDDANVELGMRPIPMPMPPPPPPQRRAAPKTSTVTGRGRRRRPCGGTTHCAVGAGRPHVVHSRTAHPQRNSGVRV